MDPNIKKQIINSYYENYKFFFSKLNVQGIGYGYKYINGVSTCEPCIQVFVTKKIPSNTLPSDALIPSLFKGVKTDVIETGTFISDCNLNTCTSSCNQCTENLNSNEIKSYLDRVRPIEPSYCMSTISNRSLTPCVGTFGYIVTDNSQVSKTYCLLSVNKTFANINKAPIGTLILQPAYNYGGRAPLDVVAKLLRYIELKFSNFIPDNLQEFNTIDASIASYVNVGEVQLLNPYIPEIGIPKGTSSPTVGLPVNWTGCASGKTTSVIDSESAMLKILYQNFQYAWFKDISIAKASIRLPDHGALVCDNNINALGLVFGVSSVNRVCICKIQNIMEILNVTLLTLKT